MTPCPVCGSLDLVAFSGRPAARCTGCGSLERQRALARLAANAVMAGRGRSCLEAGPLSRRVFGDWLRARDWGYTAIDRSRRGNPHDPREVGFVDAEVDLADLGDLGDDRFDLFLAQHVMEEVGDPEGALDEIARVLRPGALALMEIPFDPARAKTEATEPDRFGKVWRFGSDLPDSVARRFDRVELVPLREGEYRGSVFACRR